MRAVIKNKWFVLLGIAALAAIVAAALWIQVQGAYKASADDDKITPASNGLEVNIFKNEAGFISRIVDENHALIFGDDSQDDRYAFSVTIADNHTTANGTVPIAATATIDDITYEAPPIVVFASVPANIAQLAELYNESHVAKPLASEEATESVPDTTQATLEEQPPSPPTVLSIDEFWQRVLESQSPETGISVIRYEVSKRLDCSAGHSNCAVTYSLNNNSPIDPIVSALNEQYANAGVTFYTIPEPPEVLESEEEGVYAPLGERN